MGTGGADQPRGTGGGDSGAGRGGLEGSRAAPLSEGTDLTGLQKVGGGVLGSGGAECWGPGVLGSVGCGYLGAVEVAAVRAREPPRPAVALIDAHIPQLDVHPHGAPTRSNGVRPGGGTRERGRGGTAVAEPGAGTQSRERGGGGETMRCQSPSGEVLPPGRVSHPPVHTTACTPICTRVCTPRKTHVSPGIPTRVCTKAHAQSHTHTRIFVQTHAHPRVHAHTAAHACFSARAHSHAHANTNARTQVHPPRLT